MLRLHPILTLQGALHKVTRPLKKDLEIAIGANCVRQATNQLNRHRSPDAYT